MFIHLGEDIIIRTNEVIAIFDQELMNDPETNRSFINDIKENQKVIDIGHHLTKSIIITDNTVYFSPFSTATLKRRAELSVNTA